MQEQFEKITGWIKEHPWLAAGILGAIIVLAYFAYKNGWFSGLGGSSTAADTTTAADTSGAASGGGTGTTASDTGTAGGLGAGSSGAGGSAGLGTGASGDTSGGMSGLGGGMSGLGSLSGVDTSSTSTPVPAFDSTSLSSPNMDSLTSPASGTLPASGYSTGGLETSALVSQPVASPSAAKIQGVSAVANLQATPQKIQGVSATANLKATTQTLTKSQAVSQAAVYSSTPITPAKSQGLSSNYSGLMNGVLYNNGYPAYTTPTGQVNPTAGKVTYGTGNNRKS